MIEQSNNNLGLDLNAGQQPSLAERVDKYKAEKNEWRGLNGSVPISASLEESLAKLQAEVKPARADLAEKIRRSILKYSVDGKSLEQIWMEKIAEGADNIRVVEGAFGFYKGDLKLETDNKPLRVSALPALVQYRNKQVDLIHETSRLARAEFGKSLRAPGVSAGDGALGVVGGLDNNQSIS